LFLVAVYLFLWAWRDDGRVTFCDKNNIPSLRSQSWVIAQYPEIQKQSDCAISGGSRVANTKLWSNAYNYFTEAVFIVSLNAQLRFIAQVRFMLFNTTQCGLVPVWTGPRVDWSPCGLTRTCKLSIAQTLVTCTNLCLVLYIKLHANIRLHAKRIPAGGREHTACW
jgi:hypothetical protein